MSEVVKLTSDLVAVDTVTPNAIEAIRIVESFLSQLGFKGEVFTSHEDGFYDVDNLIMHWGNLNAGRKFLYNGHLDVVPAGDINDWAIDPFKPEIRKNGDGVECLFGRGVEDMKGPLAAFMIAIKKALAKLDPDNNLIVITITGDEEAVAQNGTKKIVELLKTKGIDGKIIDFDFALVGEPTSVNDLGDSIKIGRRGSLSGTLTLEGKQGHAAYPEKNANPLEVLSKALDALLKPLDNGYDSFQPTNLEITSVDVGNKAFNVLPQKVDIKFNVRFNPNFDDEKLRNELIKRIDGLDLVVHGKKVSYKFDFVTCNSPAFLTDANNEIINVMKASIKEVLNVEPKISTSGGTSDARFIKDLCPVIEFGLISKTLHQVDEHVPVNDLENLVKVYEHFILAIMNSR